MVSAQDKASSLIDWLNSPELQALRQAWNESDQTMRAEDQAWWDSLSMDERARAFRQVVGLMYRAEVEERGSYRHAMYDTFKVDYMDGMSCHYMELHNLIFSGLEVEQKACMKDGKDERIDDTCD